MKRIGLCILFVLSISSLGAQQADLVKLGLRIAPNLSFATGDTDAQTGIGTFPMFGIGGGGVIEVVPIDYLSVEFGLLVSFFNYGISVQESPDPLSLRYAAMEMPLIVKGRIPTGNGSVFLGIGPDFFVLLGNTQIVYNDSVVVRQPEKVFHTALVISAGYEWKLDNHSFLSLELRYLRSFSSPLPDYSIHNNRIDVVAGWSVGF